MGETTASSDEHTTFDQIGALGHDTDDVVMNGNVAIPDDKYHTGE